MDKILVKIAFYRKFTGFVILANLIFINANAQWNAFQPDSCYRQLKVKRIYVFENSPKDLSKIIDLDTSGHRIKLVHYSASYDKKTRARKHIEGFTFYKYDSEKKLIEVVDSATYATSNDETDREYFRYDSTGTLITSTYYRNKYLSSTKVYSYSPNKKVVTRRNDSITVSERTTEFDRNFYIKLEYGYNWEPVLKNSTLIVGGDTSNFQYSDYNDLMKLDGVTDLTNTFNLKGQLVVSMENQRFMVNRDTWRTFRATLTYKYYNNGLLKSIRGYIPEYYKYEFFEN